MTMDLMPSAETSVAPTPAVEREIRIQADTLQKSFQRAGGEIVKALDDFSLDVFAGEFVVLLGPSGCGKTTLLRSLAGLETPESGDITIGGKAMYSSSRRINIPPERRRINMMFQTYALWPHMTVFQNVAYPLISNKVEKSSVRPRVLDLLERIDIPELAGQHPSDLSGGQQQRVALARALAVDPSCVLFDEPLSNVDAKVREQLRIELLDMHQRLSFSAVYVTHDQTEAMELADRLVVMRRGRIEQQGAPEEIYLRPVNRYVANFIGISNEIVGKVTAVAGSKLTVGTSLGRVSVEDAVGSHLVGDRVALIVRPENLEVAPADVPSDDANSWEATIRTRMFAGSHTEHVVVLDDGTVMQVWGAARRSTGRPGDRVRIAVAGADVHAVPAEEIT